METADLCRLLFILILLALATTKISLNLVNLRHVRKNLRSIPEEFRNKVDEEDMVRILNYSSAGTKVENVQFAVFNGLLILLIFGGGLNLLITKAGHFSNYLLSGLTFFALTGAIFWLISIPFEIFTTFHIEKVFGFNKQTFSSWLKDLFKSLLITVIIGGILGSLILTLIEKSGTYWWLYSWALLLIFGIVLTSLYPILIAPLFNKFTPLDNDDLLNRIKTIGKKSGIEVEGIFKMDAGRRSSHTNAYFTGLGKSKRIVLFDTLLESMDNEEIASVTAHEAGHWKRKHLLKSMFVSALYSFAWFFAAGKLIDSNFFYEIFSVSRKIPAAGLFLMGIIWEPVNFFINPFLLAYSRRNEREADNAVMELTSETKPFREALVKLTKENLANLNPHPAYVIFNYSHPPVTERIRRLRTIEARKNN